MGQVVLQWGRSTVSRVFRGQAGQRSVGCSAVGHVQGEKHVARWGRSTLSRLFRGAESLPPIFYSHTKRDLFSRPWDFSTILSKYLNKILLVTSDSTVMQLLDGN